VRSVARQSQARALRERLREQGFAFCRGCARIKNIATGFYPAKPSYVHPLPHSHRCRKCNNRATINSRRKRPTPVAAPYVLSDEATRRARSWRSGVRLALASGHISKLIRMDIPVRQRAGA
jgi:hypothetical protein